MTSRQDLVKIKSRALRTKVWFRALSKVERALINLTIECVEKIRSTLLARTISTIVDKILLSLEECFMTRAEEVGQEIAEKLCSLGERWKNETCLTWKHDNCFVRFLGVNALNM